MPARFEGFGRNRDTYYRAFNKAKEVLNEAAASVRSLTKSDTPPSVREQNSVPFGRFFGRNDPRGILANLERLEQVVLSDRFIISFDGGDDTSTAYVFAWDCAAEPDALFQPRMKFCPQMAKACAERGTGSAAGTIIHELSHLVLGTADHALGMKSCSKLPDSKKLANADNYRHFVEVFQLSDITKLPPLSDTFDPAHHPPR